MRSVYKKILAISIFFCMLLFSKVEATHLLGGEISIKYISSQRYRVSLNYYQDSFSPLTARDTVSVYLYDLKTKSLKQTLKLPKKTSNLLDYSATFCNFLANTDLKVVQFVYDSDVNILGFNDGLYAIATDGNYNANVSNLQNPLNDGYAFYTEMTNFNKIVNSSPEFNPNPRNIYACQGFDLTYDYSAKDINGDSLAYELMIPNESYNNSTGDFQQVLLKTGLSLSTMIPGNPPLKINSKTGMLTLNASLAGVNVFAIRVKEYRKGVYIGQNTSIHQLFVLQCNKLNNKPKLEAIDPSTNQSFTKNYTYNLDNSVDNCLQMVASDTSAGQTLTVSLVADNFNDVSLNSVATLPVSSYVTKTKTDKFNFQICIPKCIQSSVVNPTVKVVLKSINNCSLPNYDTLLLKINNTFTGTSTRIVTNPTSTVQIASVGNNLKINVTAIGSNSNSFSLLAQGRNFNLSDKNMTFPTVSGVGTITSDFTYIPNCGDDALSPLNVKFYTVSKSCVASFDSAIVQIKIVDTLKIIPKIYLIPNLTTQTAKVGKNLNLQLMAINNSLDKVMLFARGKNFKLVNINMICNSILGVGTVNTNFTFTPICENLTQSPYKVTFYAQKLGCSQTSDSISVLINVEDDTLRKPTIILKSDSLTQTAFIGNKFTINMTSFSTGLDKLSIYAKGKDFNLADRKMTFSSVTGIGTTLTSDFNYNPICTDTTFNPSTIIFYAKNVACRTSFDSVSVKLSIKERQPTDTKLFINPFTPMIDATIGQKISLQIKGINNGYDKLNVYSKGKNFNLSDKNMISASVTGTGTISSDFNYTPKCEDLAQSPYNIQFYSKTFGCKEKFDSNSVIINVKEDIQAPKLYLDPSATSFDVKMGVQLAIKLKATNNGINNLMLYAKGKGFNLSERNMTCNSISGTGTITSDFVFTPLCQDLAFSPFTVSFYAKNSSCVVTFDSISVVFNAIDSNFSGKVELYNFISPNGDGFNDYFDINNLPQDNCFDKFSQIEIFNRWGNRVFKSTDRGFKWDAKDLPDGMYFYHIVFKNASYKNWIEIIR